VTISRAVVLTSPWPGWQAANGNQSVDLSGYQPGTIYQDVSIIAGQTYLLSFAVAGNPYEGPAIKRMEIWWDTALVDTVVFDTTGFSYSNMGWVYHEYSVVASNPFTRLEFRSLTDGTAGPALDDVSLTLVPLPNAALLVVFGAGIVEWKRHRRT
jgi:choice-of-anchor C domain-containing protein